MPQKTALRRARKNTAQAIFVTSVLLFAGVLGAGGLYFMPHIVRAAQENRAPQFIVLEAPTQAAAVIPIHTSTPISAATLRPTADPLPSPTPLPFGIAAPGASPTPRPSATPTPRSAPIIIGTSVEGRPLEVFAFGETNRPHRRLIVAGIHGGYEGNTVELAYQLMTYLYDNPQVIPPDVTLFILPNLNPDGYARGPKADPDARANARNVDLNRNWPYQWSATWDRNGCFSQRILSAGKYGGSEPEVGSLINFITLWKPDAILSYHSAALGILPGGRPDFPPSIALAEAISKVSPYPYPPLDLGCHYTGNLTDWAASTQGIPSVDIELNTHIHTDFDINLRILQVFLTWRR